MSIVVAVDGPAGSGKSSVSRAVATRLGIGYLDTGAMYRAATLWVLLRGGDPESATDVATALHDLPLVIDTDPGKPRVVLGSDDVTEEIRASRVTAVVSAVSAVPDVRREMVALQRAVARRCAEEKGGVVVEGRDIGTAVLPDATVKVYLTADVAARAARRNLEDVDAGRSTRAVDTTETALLARDAADSGRAVSPLAKASDAIVVDATHLSLQEVVDEVMRLINERPGGASCCAHEGPT